MCDPQGGGGVPPVNPLSAWASRSRAWSAVPFRIQLVREARMSLANRAVQENRQAYARSSRYRR